MSKRSISTTPDRSSLMKRVRQSGTDPELTVRRLLTSLGASYRLNVKGLSGSPDIANKRRRKAIFVHGCFWHFHEHCKRSKVPATNRSFWTQKLVNNRRRDVRKQEQLQDQGYDVLVVWQCEIEDSAKLTRTLKDFWFPEDEQDA